MNTPEIMKTLEDCVDAAVPVVLLYNSRAELKARVVRIDRMAQNAQGLWYISGEDSLSGEYRSFQVKSINHAHPLSFGPLISVKVTFTEEDSRPLESDAFQLPIVQEGRDLIMKLPGRPE